MNTKILSIIIGLALGTTLAGCNMPDANVSNANSRVNSNMNTNTNVNVANTNRARTSSDPLWGPDLTREDYERNREDYEREKGDSTIGSGPNDMWLWVKTKASLASVNDLRDSTINVDVEDEVVTLRGTVASSAHKRSAEDTAKAIEGVKSVKNELKVSANDTVTNQIVNGDSRDDANSNR